MLLVYTKRLILNAMALSCPVGTFRLMSAYPSVEPTSEERTLADYADLPTVMHLYTG